MSVLVKGMTTPKNCEECKFSWWDVGHLYCEADGKPWGLEVTEYADGRHPNCPIIEVTEDVQPVVRCKDCKHFHLDYFGEVYGVNIIVAHEICDLWAGGCRTTQDTFCSNGVRKDGGENG